MPLCLYSWSALASVDRRRKRKFLFVNSRTCQRLLPSICQWDDSVLHKVKLWHAFLIANVRVSVNEEGLSFWCKCIFANILIHSPQQALISRIILNNIHVTIACSQMMPQCLHTEAYFHPPLSSVYHSSPRLHPCNLRYGCPSVTSAKARSPLNRHARPLGHT